jgi:hypothetical protein
MSEISFQWIESEANQFLSPVDAYIVFAMIQALDSNNPRICEIGVWKGGWIASLCNNINQIAIYAVDPYPGLPSIKQEFEENVLNKYSNVKLYSSTSELLVREPGIQFNLVHIDGEHSEVAVLRDLDYASNNLSEQGIIVVDDIWHESFPGIASATMKFIHNSNFVPFLISGAKMYLTREDNYAKSHEITTKLLAEANLKFNLDFKTGTYGESYIQENDIKGHKQIILQKSQRDLKPFMNSIKEMESFGARIVKRLKSLEYWLTPPIFQLVVKSLVGWARRIQKQ